jgi:SAM-dependent methyltransferase
MTCPICRADSSLPVAGPQRRWHYQRCRTCGHQWLAPIPDEQELAEHYNTAYSVPRDNYIAEQGIKARQIKPIIAAVTRGTGRMLEIGCSYGALLKAFRDDGWDVDGVEIDARASQYAHDTYGLNVIAGTLEQAAPALRAPYDLVMMHHVLEHITDPIGLCRLVRSLMSDDGAFVIRTPNASSTVCRWSDGWWEWALAPEHVHLFSQASLERLLRQSGFTVRVAVTRRGDAHPTPYELIRANVKRLIRAGRRGPTAAADAGAPAPPPLRTHPWYVVADAAFRALLSPANLGFAAAAKLGVVSESELVVAADAAHSAAPAFSER